MSSSHDPLVSKTEHTCQYTKWKIYRYVCEKMSDENENENKNEDTDATLVVMY